MLKEPHVTDFLSVFDNPSRDYQKIVLSLHRNPDPDSICSNLVMREILQEMGKDVVVLGGDSFNPDDFPYFHEYHQDIFDVSIEEYSQDFDLLISLDTAKPSRISQNYELANGHDVVVFDHHAGNSFDQARCQVFLDTKASSTCEMIAELARFFDLKLSDAAYRLLYCGIYSDTMGFTVNIGPKTFFEASYLRDRVNPDSLVNAMNQSWSKKDFQAFSELLPPKTLTAKSGHQVIVMVSNSNKISNHKLQEMLLKMKHDLLIVGSRIGSTRNFRLSISSTCDPNWRIARKLAKIYGGGGHPNRAGAVLEETNKQQIINSFVVNINRIFQEAVESN
jgi:phosphoesterase RecJ-like protein